MEVRPLSSLCSGYGAGASTPMMRSRWNGLQSNKKTWQSWRGCGTTVFLSAEVHRGSKIRLGRPPATLIRRRCTVLARAVSHVPVFVNCRAVDEIDKPRETRGRCLQVALEESRLCGGCTARFRVFHFDHHVSASRGQLLLWHASLLLMTKGARLNSASMITVE